MWIVVSCSKTDATNTPNAPGVGQPLPFLALDPLTGADREITLNDIRGKVALINFWGTWCPPCVLEFPHMVSIWDRHRDNPDFIFLSVSSSGGVREDVEAVREETAQFLRREGTMLPTYIDAKGGTRQVVASLMNQPAISYPTTLIVDRSGIIRQIWPGYAPGLEHEIEKMLSKLLAEK